MSSSPEREELWIARIRAKLNPTLNLDLSTEHPYQGFHIKAIKLLSDEDLADALNAINEAKDLENPSAWFGGCLKKKCQAQGVVIGRRQ